MGFILMLAAIPLRFVFVSSFSGIVHLVPNQKNEAGSHSIASFRLHREVNFVRGAEFDGARVAGIGVAKNAHTWVAGENAFEPTFGIFTAVGNDNHAGV